MQVTINLTAVLITLIICVFLYAMCKMARRDEKKKKQNFEDLVDVTGLKERRNNMHVVDNRQEGEGRQ